MTPPPQGDLATKADLAALQAAAREEFASVKSDVASLRREVSSLRTLVFSVVIPMLLANMGLTVAVLIHLIST